MITVLVAAGTIRRRHFAMNAIGPDGRRMERRLVFPRPEPKPTKEHADG